MLETKSLKPLTVYRRPRGVTETVDSLRAQLDEAWRVNDQLAREIATQGEPHVLVIRKYWMADDHDVTLGELARTLDSMLGASICRPYFRALVDETTKQIVGLELVAAVTPIAPTTLGDVA